MIQSINTNADTIQRNDYIRAYDFQPVPGRGDSYIEGIATNIILHNGALVYVVLCQVDMFAGKLDYDRINVEVFVPVETNRDYVGRLMVKRSDLLLPVSKGNLRNYDLNVNHLSNESYNIWYNVTPAANADVERDVSLQADWAMQRKALRILADWRDETYHHRLNAFRRRDDR